MRLHSQKVKRWHSQKVKGATANTTKPASHLCHCYTASLLFSLTGFLCDLLQGQGQLAMCHTGSPLNPVWLVSCVTCSRDRGSWQCVTQGLHFSHLSGLLLVTADLSQHTLISRPSLRSGTLFLLMHRVFKDKQLFSWANLKIILTGMTKTWTTEQKLCWNFHTTQQISLWSEKEKKLFCFEAKHDQS